MNPALLARVRRRVPAFAFDYVDGGAGDEACKLRNRAALDATILTPSFANDLTSVDASATLFSRTYRAPLGVAPIGGGDLLWPGAGGCIAHGCSRTDLLYISGTYSNLDFTECQRIDSRHDWFQLYVAKDSELNERMLSRLIEAHVRVLVVTVDCPAAAHRPRQSRHALDYPATLRLSLMLDAVRRPLWCLGTLKRGLPRFPNVDRFATQPNNPTVLRAFHQAYGDGVCTTQAFRFVRDRWPGPLVVKGILSVHDLRRYVDLGADGAVVSNHGGRQFDASPASISVLPALRSAAGREFPLIVDGGCESGLDVARFIAAGADFVLMGRRAYYALACGGPKRLSAFLEQTIADYASALSHLGCEETSALRNRFVSRSANSEFCQDQLPDPENALSDG